VNDKLLTAFEECLHDLEIGVGLDEALARYPSDLAAELRPMLEVVAVARPSRPEQPRPEAAQASRARFLAQAGEARQQRRRSPWAWLFSPTPLAVKRRTFALQFASAFFIGAVALSSVLALSAAGSALPGDGLYGLKRAVEGAQLALAPQPAARVDLEAEFADRRIAEAQALLAAGREAPVSFTGDIQVIEGDRWVVSNVPVQVGAQLATGFGVGDTVRVSGLSNRAADAIVAETVELLTVATPTETPTLAPAPSTTPLPATATAEPTPEPTATQAPTQAPSATLPVATVTPLPPIVTATVGGSSPGVTATVDDHGGGSDDRTPEPEETDDSDDDDDDGGSDNSGPGGGGGGDDSDDDD